MNSKELGKHINIVRAKWVGHAFHLVFILIIFATMISIVATTMVSAVPLGTRSLTISTPAAGAVANHNFSLELTSAASTGSIGFEYCQESPLFDQTCTSPPGLDLSSATLSAQSGETGFIILSPSSTNKITLTRVPSVVTPGTSTYSFSGVINPNQPNTSTFVRVASYASTNGAGARNEEGGLAFAITNPLYVQAFLPPFLTLCTGVTVAVNCSSSSGSSVNFGELSSQSSRSATSQFSIATNDDSGYNSFILGSTMTSGSFIIPQSNTQSPSSPGTGQFGLNLVANSNPVVGSIPNGTGTGTVSASYDDSNLFKFTSGDFIAGSSQTTDFNRFTLSYVVNVSSDQSPGLYTTTMTILGVADF